MKEPRTGRVGLKKKDQDSSHDKAARRFKQEVSARFL
jgi:hypothetical protein